MSADQLARDIVHQLRKAGHTAYFVGGCVRDLLLGVPPVDFDVATSAIPEQILQLFPAANLVGVSFGVVIVRDGDAEVEVATYRRDHEYHDGRRPTSVVFEPEPVHDVERRDFTINALLYDPETGDVLDYVGGQNDLHLKTIRAIGNPEKRFREDHLRLLRAVRFSARLQFDIESETEAAIVRLHPLVKDIAPERVRDELVRMLVGPHPRQALEMLERFGMLNELLPEVSDMKGVKQPPAFHPEGDVWTHTLLMLDRMEHATPTLALGVLLHDVGKPPTYTEEDRIRFNGHVEAGVQITHAIMMRLRFSNEEIREVEALVANHMRFKDAPAMKDSTLKRFMRLPHFDEHLELHRVDCLSSHGSLENYEFVKRRREEFGEEQIRPQRLLNGNDLAALGVQPGPTMGTLLQAIEDAQLEGRIQTAEEARIYAQSLIAGSR